MNALRPRHAVWLAAALLLPTLGLRSLWPPDETRYADVARGMRAHGDFVVPRLDGELYGEKPPVFFWAIAAANAAGVPLGAAPRLVSIASGVATVALVPGIAAALGLAAPLGTRAALVLATTPLFLVYAQLGLLDAASTFLVTGAIAAKLARAGRRGARRTAFAVVEGLVLGAALLTKGPVLLLFPLGLRVGAALAPALSGPRAASARDSALARAASARESGLARESGPGPDASDLVSLGIALTVALAWVGAAAASAGVDYARSITIGQAVRRMAGDAPHLRPPGFLLAVTALGFLPWTLFGVDRLVRAAAAGGRRSGWRPWRGIDAGTGALLGWLFLPLALLSLLATQQPHYALPGLPAAALLVAPSLEAAPVWIRRTLAGLGVGLALLLLAASFGADAVFATGPPPQPATRAALADLTLRAIAACAGGALLALSLRRTAAGGLWRRAAAGSAVAFAAVVLLVWRIDRYVAPWALLADPHVTWAPRLAADGSLRTSLRVATGRDDVVGVGGDLARQLAADPGLVAVLREPDLSHAGVEDGELEVLARGFSRGHVAIAVRARPGSGRPDSAAVSAEDEAAAPPPGSEPTRPPTSP